MVQAASSRFIRCQCAARVGEAQWRRGHRLQRFRAQACNQIRDVQTVGSDIDHGQIGIDAVDAGHARQGQRAELDDLRFALFVDVTL